MKGSPTSPLAGCLLPLLLLASTGVSGGDQLSPSRSFLGLMPPCPACKLSPAQSASHMYIRWYRAQLTPAVLVFHDGQEQGDMQMQEYQGRTQMVRDAIAMGNVALQIQQVQASDDGLYHCQVTHGFTSQEAVMELRVIGLGSVPLVHMTGPENNGIQVSCSSSGWFPKPRVQWRNNAGNTLLSSFESQTLDGDGLFHVVASLLVTDRAVGNVTCSIQNPLHDQEKVKAIFLPEPFFPRTSPWNVALSCLFSTLLILFSGISLAGWKEHLAKRREMEKKSEELLEMLQTKKEVKTALKKRDDLQAELDQRKALYREGKQLYQPVPQQDKSDPKTEESSREETAHPSLSNPQVAHNIIMLYQEGFMLERYYWEVDVGDTEEWCL
ncbi:Btnl1 [Phodopus roborovskii]|uniref:Btnl1 protein n=1 Tax=Phodopus roborovskii TaxID=109678 RepID=A0AAU9ZEB7_PHORO|nr:Btnl1 [Phodopus roborovskii]